MKEVRRFISVVLAVLMITCSISALSFSASAAETTTAGGTVTISSNVGTSVQTTYNAESKQIVATYLFQSDYMLLNEQTAVTYDSTVLKLASTNTYETCTPNFLDGTVINLNIKDKILFNSASLSLYNFKQQKVFATFVFDIVGSGDTAVNLELQVMTGTEANNYDEVATASDVPLVDVDGNVMETSKFSMVCQGSVIQEQQPTTEAPTTVEPTVAPTTVEPTVAPTTVAPTTVEPTEAPTTVEPTVAPTTVEPTVAPTTVEPTVAPTTVAPTTEAPTVAPTTQADADYSNYYVRGNIYLALAETTTANVVTGKVQLKNGTFKFDITNMTTGTHYGRNSKYTDSINNAMFGANWGYCTLTTTGGTYTFTYNTKTNKLTVTYDSSSSSNFSNYRVRGSFNFALNTTENTGIVKNTIALPVGKYKFNVSDEKLIYGRMAEYTDSIGRALFGSSWGYCTITVSQPALYEFSYDTSANQLTVLPKTTADSSYSIIGTNIGAVLKTTETANEVTTTVTLDAGAYKFKVVNMDTAIYYGRGASYTDTMSSAMFGAGWDWCTLNATGGTYTFTYNTKTNKMTVVKAA